MLFDSCTSSCYIVLLLVLSPGGSAKGDGDDEGGSLSAHDFDKAAHTNYSGEKVHDEDGSTNLFEGDIELSDDDKDAFEQRH